MLMSLRRKVAVALLGTGLGLAGLFGVSLPEADASPVCGNAKYGLPSSTTTKVTIVSYCDISSCRGTEWERPHSDVFGVRTYAYVCAQPL